MSLKNREREGTVAVWDLPTRLFRWLLVAFAGLAWISSEADGGLSQIHVFGGVGVMALIVFRIPWGFIGGRPARFFDFVRPWPVVRDYAKRLIVLSPPRHLGHNPLGGWMILALIAVLSMAAVSGLFAADDANAGPLAGLLGRGSGQAMEELHEGLAALLGFLLAAHVLGVLAHGLMAGENLPRAMWTGRKAALSPLDGAAGGTVGWWRVRAAEGASLAVVWVVVA